MTVKRIAIHCQGFGIGGIERVVSVQIHEFCTRGIRILLLLESPLPSRTYPLPASITILELPRKTDLDARIQAILNAIANFKPDVYYDHDYGRLFTATQRVVVEWMSIRKASGIPVFLHWHSTFAQLFYAAKIADLVENLHPLRKSLDGIIVLSRTDEAFFRHLGFNAFYILNPIDIQLRDLPATSALNEQILLWVGRLNAPVKRPQDALRTFAKVHAALPKSKLNIVGAGNKSEIQFVKELADEFGISQHVRFVINQSDVYDFFRHSSVLLQTSRFEGFPMVNIEAMAHRLPIVSYDLPYLETMRDNAGAICVEQGNVAALADQAVALLKSPDQLAALSSASHTTFMRLAQVDHCAEVLSVLSGERPPTKPDAESTRIAEDILFQECAKRLVRDERLFHPLRKPLPKTLLKIASLASDNWHLIYKWAQGKYIAHSLDDNIIISQTKD